jgi:hypothetical protein
MGNASEGFLTQGAGEKNLLSIYLLYSTYMSFYTAMLAAAAMAI